MFPKIFFNVTQTVIARSERIGRRFLFKDLNKLKLVYPAMQSTLAFLFKPGVSIGRWNCSTNEAKNKLFSGVSESRHRKSNGTFNAFQPIAI